MILYFSYDKEYLSTMTHLTESITTTCADCDKQFKSKTEKQAALYKRLHAKKCIRTGKSFSSNVEKTTKRIEKQLDGKHEFTHTVSVDNNYY